MTTTIYSLPQNFIRSASWAQSDQRRNLQRSEFTGRTRETIIGPADRWTCAADIRPMRAGDIETWRAFQAQMKLPGARCRVGATEASQYGALGNITPGATAAEVAAWLRTGMQLRPPSAATVAGFVPADSLFFPPSGAGIVTALANGGTALTAAPGTYFAETWGLIGSGTTGTASLRLEWRNASDAVISTSILTADPGSQLATPNQWIRVASTFTAPALTASVRVFFQAQTTSGSTFLAAPRVSTLPARAAVSGSSNAGSSLALSGLAPSQRNLRAGQMLTVTLPGDDEQLIMLTADLLADASGNGTAQLGSPLRRSPANDATVELNLPWGLMRTTDPLGWSVDPAPIYGARQIIFEEAF